MNKFITINHTPAQSGKTPSSQIYIEIHPEINFILDETDFPLKINIRKILNQESCYTVDLYPNMWCVYNWFENSELVIHTSNDVLLVHERWNPATHGAENEFSFNLWSKLNKGSKGVVIGTNDGAKGEYVLPFLEGCYSKILMVEGSADTFQKLKRNFEFYSNVITLNHVVTPLGGEITFYEASGGTGETNSLNKDHVKNFWEEEIKETKINSVSINNLLIDNNFQDLDWLHLDVEGIDGELIKALDFNLIKKPKAIIYEKTNFEDDNQTINFLKNNGYEVWIDQSNGFSNLALLK